MDWSWADLYWCWVGLGLSAILMILLFGTDKLRGNTSLSRWRDPYWLAWLAPAAYMIHQFEEYGVSLEGARFAFPDVLCASMGFEPYPVCSLPESLFIAINVPAIWIAGLICALVARRHPFVGLGIYAILFVNSLAHLGVWVAGEYNPGALTALLIQLPLSLWAFYACFGPGKMRRSGIGVLIGAGGLLSAVLLGSVKLFALGHLSAVGVVLVQILNPAWVILLPWLFERRILGGAVARA